MKHVSMYLPDETYEWLRREAFERRTSMGKIVDAALRLAPAEEQKAAAPRRKKGGK